MSCPFCYPAVLSEGIILENELCLFLQQPEPILVGSGLIIPRQHRTTVFDLTPQEWAATYDLLLQVQLHLNTQYGPDGYNVGWNCGATAGQAIFHAHLHVIPRYDDEPLAGKGIRYWIKQETNRRTARHGAE